MIDDFCPPFGSLLEQRMLDEGRDKRRQCRTGEMLPSDMTRIVVLFHTMRGPQFKAFDCGIVCRFMPAEFPRRVSYTCSMALMPCCAALLAALLLSVT